jgi:predicted RecB family nuclease
MATKITREVLEGYLHCKTKGHLKLAGQHGSKSDYEELLATTRQEVRQTAIERILARQPEGQLPRDVPLTAATLGSGPPYVLGATLEDDLLSLEYDGLKRVDKPSKLGDFHYVPILFHEGRKVGPQQRLLLELYGLLLHRIQARLPAFGLVWHGPECKGSRIPLNPERRRADRLLREAEAMAGSGSPPRLMLNDHCTVCEFRRSCSEEARARDDLSLLRGMSEEEVKKYGKRGIFTVTQLSCTFRPRRTTRRAQANGPPHSHALQALAIREKKIHVIGRPELPVCASQIYFDIEGDPERGFVYLIGMVVVTGETEERFSFWADSPSEEPELFDQFLGIVRRQEDARLFTYGSYEAQFLRRMGKLSARQEPVEGILAKTHNVLSIIYSHVYFPVYFNGLKEVAGSLGFAWTEPNASGVQSVVWRRRWEATGSSELRDKLTTYNIEDCLALRRVTEFLHAICPDRGPDGSKSLAGCEGHAVARVEDLNPVSTRREWCQAEFAIPDFDFVNKRAYFDYQRDRVFIRSSKLIKKNQARRHGRTGKKDLRADRSIELASEECPSCGGVSPFRRLFF